MAKKERKLFTGFAPVSTEDWESKIHADLKGADYEKKLVWRTYEGFKVQPYYRKEDLKGLDFLACLPGEYPFVRGNKKSGNDWFIRQDISVKDLKKANKKALEILNKGVTSLGFRIDSPAEISQADLEILLKDILPEAIEINFDSTGNSSNCARAFNEFISGKDINKEEIIGSAPFDPLGSFVLRGILKEDAFATMKKMVEDTAELPLFRVIGVNGKTFANCGASLVQELAFSLAQGTEYLTRLTNAGASIEEVTQNIKFHFGIGSNHFMEIAKLRAARLLWAQIVNAYGPAGTEATKLIAHSETNTFNKTFYDPYVNMIRTQTEAMAAVLGGADSITVRPFNTIFGETSDMAERIARNQQILLKEESHLDKIADPGGGAYYIENLTAALAEHAWELFLQIQDKGGFIKAFREGFIQEEIKNMAARRKKNIATRRENLLGTNQFPNFLEQAEKAFDASVFIPEDHTEPGAEVETLKPWRGAQPFERLRYKTDRYALENKRPVAFMLPMGNLAFRKARAQFSTNFFAVAGFEVIDNNGFKTPEEGVAAAKAKNADIVVVCSSDDEYATLVPEVARKLNDEILVVAGNPACRADLEKRGITHFIHVKSNILEELKKYQEKLNI